MPEDLSLNYFKHPLIWPNVVERRLYQEKIAEGASNRNTLVILPTALGKTVISAIVTANILYHYRNIRVLVMAPTRPLVMQHQMSFLKLLKLREKDAVLLTGTTPPEQRKTIWEGAARIVFSTPQVVRNDLIEKRLSLKDYGLLVFDECHRAVKRYAYTAIADFYISQATYPLILGMTASPGSKLDRILEVCRNLYIERVEYRNEEDTDVKPYIQPIDVTWIRVDLPHEYLEMRIRIRTMLNKRLFWLYNKGVLRCKPKYATKRSMIEVGDELRFMLEESIDEERSQIFTAIINQSLALTLFHMLELLETQGAWTLRAFLDRIAEAKREKRSYTMLVNDPTYKGLLRYLDTFPVEHPKLGPLRKTVDGQLHSKPSSRMLIFTQYRDTASHLVAELNKVDGVTADRFVGQASKLMDKGLTQEEQAERIRMLEDGELNVLVATSVAEEGLDIPAVDHVVFYEPIPSAIRYIQRRGRTGRKSPGRVTILATNESLDMVYLYASERKTETMRCIAHDINSKLHPIIRVHPKPPPNPLTPKELETLGAEAGPVSLEPAIVQREFERAKTFNRQVDRASRRLYGKLLERGASGASINQLAFEMELNDAAIPILKGALGKLIKAGFVTELGQERYAVTSSLKSLGKTHDITVEKIGPSTAVVMVDDKWRARLTPDDYHGPQNLIKKRSRFRAEAQLYTVEGTLYIAVKDVTKILRCQQ